MNQQILFQSVSVFASSGIIWQLVFIWQILALQKVFGPACEEKLKSFQFYKNVLYDFSVQQFCEYHSNIFQSIKLFISILRVVAILNFIFSWIFFSKSLQGKDCNNFRFLQTDTLFSDLFNFFIIDKQII